MWRYDRYVCNVGAWISSVDRHVPVLHAESRVMLPMMGLDHDLTLATVFIWKCMLEHVPFTHIVVEIDGN